MKTFLKKVDMRRRKTMTGFLRDHRRYWTMNNWNRSASYANCIKIHKLGLTTEQLENAWEMLDMPQVYDAIHVVLEEWAIKHEWLYQIGFNGRSSGYLVLYQGGLDYEHARTAQCDECWKLTWHKQDTPCTSDYCGGTLRVLCKPRPQIVTYPGRGLDESGDFKDWTMDELRERVRLIRDFDQVCDTAVSVFVRFCEEYRVVEKDILVPKIVKILELV
ncbi:MAG: hypothetical protein HON70_01445 [Lentisphaerae bacterium]|nr:hypothetical protein [Lentisphaerota bacterium]